MLSRIGPIALGMFLAVALAVGFVTAQPGATLEPNDRVAVGLNVRAEARSDAQIFAVLRPGDRVTQIGAVPFGTTSGSATAPSATRTSFNERALTMRTRS